MNVVDFAEEIIYMKAEIDFLRKENKSMEIELLEYRQREIEQFQESSSMLGKMVVAALEVNNLRGSKYNE